MAIRHHRTQRGNESLKIVQLNAQHKKTVPYEICQTAVSEGCSILLLQEPYYNLGKLVGYSKCRKIYHLEDTPWAAIVVLNPEIAVVKISHLCSDHFAVVEVTWKGESIYLVSGYFQFSDEIGPYLAQLDDILQSLTGRKVIIGLDSNAKSTLWECQTTDRRGDEVENFISQWDLTLENVLGELPTTTTKQGEGRPDITLTTSNLAGRLKSWTVREGWSTGDHRAITYELRERDTAVKYAEKAPIKRYNTRKQTGISLKRP